MSRCQKMNQATPYLSSQPLFQLSSSIDRFIKPKEPSSLEDRTLVLEPSAKTSTSNSRFSHFLFLFLLLKRICICFRQASGKNPLPRQVASCIDLDSMGGPRGENRRFPKLITLLLNLMKAKRLFKDRTSFREVRNFGKEEMELIDDLGGSQEEGHSHTNLKILKLIFYNKAIRKINLELHNFSKKHLSFIVKLYGKSKNPSF